MNKRKVCVAVNGDYKLFKNEYNLFELYLGENLMGYVTDPMNLSSAIAEVEEELRCLMAESV